MELKINTKSPVKENTIIDQKADFIKSRTEFENGFIIISTVSPEGIYLDHSHKFKKELDGSLTPILNNKNPNFKDIK